MWRRISFILEELGAYGLVILKLGQVIYLNKYKFLKNRYILVKLSQLINNFLIYIFFFFCFLFIPCLISII